MPPKTKVDVKKAEQDRLQGLVLALLREEENKYCADCDGKQPRWASWNLGVFICIRCAGIHRNLGVHVSKVKSVNLDSWTAEQVQSMRVMGNAKAKVVYEAELPEHFRRPQTDQTLESFIRAKYEHKRHMLRGWVPPRVDINDLPPAGHENNRVHIAPATTTSALRAPAPVKAQVSPKAGGLVTGSVSAELLDISSPAVAPTQPAQSVPSLLDFDFSSSAQPTPVQTTTVPASNNADLDDIFGSFVSASTTGPAPAASAPNPSSEVSGISSDLSSLSVSSADEKKSNNDILALFGNMPKAMPTSQPVQQCQPPQHNWGGGLFSTPTAQPAQQQLPQMNFNASFGSTSQPPPMNMGGFNMSSTPPMPSSFQSNPVTAVPPAPTMNTSAFDSLSLNNLFPGGLSTNSYGNPQQAAVFAAASPFNQRTTAPIANANTFNLDSLL